MIPRAYQTADLFLLGGLLAAAAAVPLRAASPPSFTEIRAIQYTYSAHACQVVVEWKIENGPFDEIRASIDGSPSLLAGNARGITFLNVAPGTRTVRVEGKSGEDVIFDEFPFPVLSVSPVEQVRLRSCIYFAHDPMTGKGYLQIAWDTPPPPAVGPYLEYEISLDGKFLLVTKTADRAITLSGIEEGSHTVQIIGITRSYAAPPARKTFEAEGVPPPQDLRLKVRCYGVSALGRLEYRVPAGASPDAVAVWTRAGEDWEFEGYFAASAGETSPDGAIDLSDLPLGKVDIEASLVLFEEDRETPRAMTNLPGKPGAHGIIHEEIGCRDPDRFRRGDIDSNGKVNITDSIRLLTFLFLGTSPLPCPVSGDADDNDLLEITDGISILSFLFMAGPDLEPPGPWICGEDPTPGFLQECDYEACDS